MKFRFHFSVMYTYEVITQRKIHFAANESLFHIIRDYNVKGQFQRLKVFTKSDIKQGKRHFANNLGI